MCLIIGSVDQLVKSCWCLVFGGPFLRSLLTFLLNKSAVFYYFTVARQNHTVDFGADRQCHLFMTHRQTDRLLGRNCVLSHLTQVLFLTASASQGSWLSIESLILFGGPTIRIQELICWLPCIPWETRAIMTTVLIIQKWVSNQFPSLPMVTNPATRGPLYWCAFLFDCVRPIGLSFLNIQILNGWLKRVGKSLEHSLFIYWGLTICLCLKTVPFLNNIWNSNLDRIKMENKFI